MKRSASGLELEIAKPVFLTKSERERIALDRRQAAVSDRHHSAIDLLRSVPRSPSPPPLPTHPSRDRDRGCRRDRDSPDRDRDRGRRRDRNDSSHRERGKDRKVRERRPDSHMQREQDRDREKIAERLREKELEAIKEQYLGSKKPKKRVIIKPSEKFRFSFDWENTEDTSRDMTNTLYQSPHEARLLFGRGFHAGVDRREQKKVSAQHDKEIRAELRRKAGGAGESLALEEDDDLVDKKAADAADSYDAFDMRVDRHRSEKSAEEMTERDWRIFREDFNIAYKGSRIPRPMRSWSESKLGAELLDAIAAAGYRKPSPIQMAAIPLGLSQRDVIGIAETGSGSGRGSLCSCPGTYS